MHVYYNEFNAVFIILILSLFIIILFDKETLRSKRKTFRTAKGFRLKKSEVKHNVVKTGSDKNIIVN